MEERLIKTMLGQYVSAVWNGVDETGYTPVGDNIIVLPDVPAEKTDGGIFLSDQQRERQAFAAETGVLIKLGDDAFTWNSDRSRPFQGQKPRPGQRVVFKKYSGVKFIGKDGKEYWVMSDHCIGVVETLSA